VSVVVEGLLFYLILGENAPMILDKSNSGLEGGTMAGLIFIITAAGPIEEALKFFILWQFIYQNNNFNQVADGFFYAVTLALGFSFIENVLYFFDLNSGEADELVAGALLRGVATMLLHITAAGLVGYALGKKKFTPKHKKSLVFWALSAAIILHATFNCLTLVDHGIFLSFPLVIFFFLYLLRQIHKPENRMVWKLVSPSGSEIQNH
jgi:RsiW-degrading membrane proteinase PrsW (M82 family)